MKKSSSPTPSKSKKSLSKIKFKKLVNKRHSSAKYIRKKPNIKQRAKSAKNRSINKKTVRDYDSVASSVEPTSPKSVISLKKIEPITESLSKKIDKVVKPTIKVKQNKYIFDQELLYLSRLSILNKNIKKKNLEEDDIDEILLEILMK